ncbi:MAG: hypothetical protein KJ065_04505 [Anaerolineae bacterium]|nr:hypothetical protein [Anaerolineae bacterium]
MNPDPIFPSSIFSINKLDEAEKVAIYRTLIPDWVFDNYGIDRESLTVGGKSVVRFRCPSGSRALEVSVWRQPGERDPMLYFNMVDTFNFQLLVLLVVVNDPEAPRFNIDRDEDGNDTQLGTIARNLHAEERAMQAGLAPGQVRSGLRVFRQSVPVFEQFIANMGHDMFLIEPLAYHNAIVFERYGFNYVRGFREMQRIHQEFQPGGELHMRLDPAKPFRQPDAWRTIRGRSWAIHDGILGHPYTGFQMYKRIGQHAGVSTFPDGTW